MILLVALDLGDQAAQNAAMTRLLIAADPQVALLDAAVEAIQRRRSPRTSSRPPLRRSRPRTPPSASRCGAADRRR